LNKGEAMTKIKKPKKSGLKKRMNIPIGIIVHKGVNNEKS